MKKTILGMTFELSKRNADDECCEGCEVSGKFHCDLFSECTESANLDKVWQLVPEDELIINN